MAVRANEILTFCSKPKAQVTSRTHFFPKKIVQKKATYLSTENKTLHYIIFVKCIYRLFHVKRFISMFLYALYSFLSRTTNVVYFLNHFSSDQSERTSADMPLFSLYVTE